MSRFNPSQVAYHQAAWEEERAAEQAAREEAQVQSQPSFEGLFQNAPWVLYVSTHRDKEGIPSYHWHQRDEPHPPKAPRWLPVLGETYPDEKHPMMRFYRDDDLASGQIQARDTVENRQIALAWWVRFSQAKITEWPWQGHTELISWAEKTQESAQSIPIPAKTSVVVEEDGSLKLRWDGTFTAGRMFQVRLHPFRDIEICWNTGTDKNSGFLAIQELKDRLDHTQI